MLRLASPAAVAELVDAQASGACRDFPVEVRVLSAASMLKTLALYLKRTPKVDAPTDLYTHRLGLLEGGERDLGSLRTA